MDTPKHKAPSEGPDRKVFQNLDVHLPEAAEWLSQQSLEARAIIQRLQDELEHAKELIQAKTEECATANEALMAAHEEMHSINDELRLTAEEYETSKEELVSVNDELLALNQELENKIDEVKGANSDLQNLMNATEIGTIFLDRRLRIKRYTPRVEDLFDIAAVDVGRPLTHLTHRLGSDALPGDAAQVLRHEAMIEREMQHVPTGQWYLVRVRPYHHPDGAVGGVVITFVDVTEKKKHDDQLEALIATLEVLVGARSDQIKQLTSELILSEQTERQRIAQILHDELQQLLYAFRMRVDMLTLSLPEEQASRLKQANTLIARALDVTRTLTVELSPAVLKGDDITVALDWLALRMDDMHNLKVEVVSPGPIHLPADLRTLVYQLVRELLFNVVKHAGIDRASVMVVQEENQLVLVVEDEGAGFDPAAEQDPQPMKKGGFGLRIGRQRLDRLGGRLEVDSAPGRGTKMTLIVPVESELLDAEARLPSP